MNSNQLEKLHTLVAGTPILSSQEKADWLSLMGMMNDKQLLELEKILHGPENSPITQAIKAVTPPQPKAPSSSVSKSAGGNITGKDTTPKIPTPKSVPGDRAEGVKTKQASSPEPKKAAEPSWQMPKLSHIVNLPKKFIEQSPDENKTAATQNTGQTDHSRSAVKIPGKYFSKFRAMFEEKELPSGKPDNELDLPVPQLKPKISAGAGMIDQMKQSLSKASVKTAASEEKIGKPSAPIQVAPAKLPPPVPRPQAKQTAPSNKVPASTPSLSLSQRTAEPKNYPKDIAVTAKQPAKKDIEGTNTALYSQSEIKPKPSYSFTGSSSRPPITQVSTPQDLPKKPASVSNSNIETLNDLASLDYEFLKAQDFNALLTKLRNLIQKYGYYEVIFNVEKSPIYSNYIQTGLQILNNKATFEQLSSNGSADGDYLSRVEFEEMADLLRQIQAG
jgi:hypothetical protein